jgi:hypothetical protein
VAIGLFASSKNAQGLQGNSNAKLAVTPHHGSTVMVRKTQKINNQDLG